MTHEQAETLLQTIQAHLERNEAGVIIWVLDPNGIWKIADLPKEGKLIRHFEPQYVVGFDPLSDEYGQMPTRVTIRSRTGREYRMVSKEDSKAYRRKLLGSRWTRFKRWLKGLFTYIHIDYTPKHTRRTNRSKRK